MYVQIHPHSLLSETSLVLTCTSEHNIVSQHRSKIRLWTLTPDSQLLQAAGTSRLPNMMLKETPTLPCVLPSETFVSQQSEEAFKLNLPARRVILSWLAWRQTLTFHFIGTNATSVFFKLDRKKMVMTFNAWTVWRNGCCLHTVLIK